MAEAHQGIKVVIQRTGLSGHVIRIWEKRYDAVGPERTGTNRRLYSDEQIERLSLLRDITQNGHRIGHVAKLPTEKLRELSKQSRGVKRPAPRALTAAPDAPTYLDDCVAADPLNYDFGRDLALAKPGHLHLFAHRTGSLSDPAIELFERYLNLHADARIGQLFNVGSDCAHRRHDSVRAWPTTASPCRAGSKRGS